MAAGQYGRQQGIPTNPRTGREHDSHLPGLRCENERLTVGQFRPLGGCPREPVTIECTLHLSRGPETHRLCTACANQFIRRYTKKGHRVTTRVYTGPQGQDPFVARVLNTPYNPLRFTTLRAFLFGARQRLFP